MSVTPRKYQAPKAQASKTQVPKTEPPKKKKKIVIVGMGPGGMVAAIEALKKGYDITLIDNRDNFIREQRIILNSDYVGSLLSKEELDKLSALIESKKGAELSETEIKGLTEDQRFYWELTGSGATPTVPLNQLQDLLLRKLDPTGALRKEGRIRMGEQHKIEGFDFTGGKNIIKVISRGKPENIEFDYFVAADGTTRTMSAAFSDASDALPPPKEEDKELKAKIEYRRLEKQVRAVPQTTTFLRLRPGRDPKKNKIIGWGKEEYTQNEIAELAEFGWTLPVFPKFYMFSNPQGTRHYIAGEIPQKIFDMEAVTPEGWKKRSEQLEKWAKKIISITYGVNADSRFELDIEPNPEKSRDIEKANRLRATAFHLNLRYTETPCVRLHKDGLFVCVGDAFMDANFYKGTGAQSAIEDSLAFINMLESYEAAPQKSSGDQKSKPTIVGDFLKDRLKRKDDLMKFMSGEERTYMRGYRFSMSQLIQQALDDGKQLQFLVDEFGSRDESLQKIKAEYEVFLKQMMTDFKEKKEKYEQVADDQLAPDAEKNILFSFDLDAIYEQNNRLTQIIDKILTKQIEEEDRKFRSEQKEQQELKMKLAKTKEKVHEPSKLISAKSKLYETHKEAVTAISAMFEKRTDKLARANIAKRAAYVAYKKRIQAAQKQSGGHKLYYAQLKKILASERPELTRIKSPPTKPTDKRS